MADHNAEPAWPRRAAVAENGLDDILAEFLFERAVERGEQWAMDSKPLGHPERDGYKKCGDLTSHAFHPWGEFDEWMCGGRGTRSPRPAARPHGYDGWTDGSAYCLCGQTFDSVQDFNRHIGFPPGAPTSEGGS